MSVSPATDPAGPRYRGSDDRRAPAGYRRERADRGADARDTPRQQIAIGMLNDMQCGDLVKLLWWDGDGLCLFAKRLERGRFVWPRAEEGVVVLSRAQLSMLLEGIDWRMPRRSWRAELGSAACGSSTEPLTKTAASLIHCRRADHRRQSARRPRRAEAPHRQ